MVPGMKTGDVLLWIIIAFVAGCFLGILFRPDWVDMQVQAILAIF